MTESEPNIFAVIFIILIVCLYWRDLFRTNRRSQRTIKEMDRIMQSHNETERSNANSNS